ncbi:MAG: hypothetical protein D6722_05465, partial [Bacteroidetes bacterium]
SEGSSPNGGLSEAERTAHIQAAKPAGWEPNPFTPRAFAEPALNKWLGQMLGPASGIRCVLRYQIDAVEYHVVVQGNHLAIQPIDLLYLLRQDPEDGGSELELRLADYARRQAVPAIPDTAELHLHVRERLPAWDEDIRTFYEIAPLVRALIDLLGDARPLTAEDLLVPEGYEEVEAPRQQLVDELALRMRDARDRLAAVHTDLGVLYTDASRGEAVAGLGPAEASALYPVLRAAAAFGLPGAYPAYQQSPGEEACAQVLNQGLSVAETLSRRLAQVDAAIAEVDPLAGDDARVEAWLDISRMLFGRDFRAIPHFAPRDVAGLQAVWAQREDLCRAMPPFGLESWRQGLAQVRPKMGALDLIDSLVQSFGQMRPPLLPLQLPYKTGDYWLGAAFPEDYAPEDKLSIVTLHGQRLLDTGGSQVGLVLDEWTEEIPFKEQRTGVAFHYDQPDATPPQSLLLAVTPVESGQWDWDDLVYTLIDTLRLAKVRAVEPAQIDQSRYAQLLPAIVAEAIPPQIQAQDDDDGQSPVGIQVVLDFGTNNQE